MTTLAIPLPKRPAHPTGVMAWLTTIDHKKIGILYGVSAFILFITGGLEALYMRVQLARPEQDLVSPEVFNQLFTMHATTMIFLGVMPLGAAFFNFVIPLQIGARDVAFPRLNAFSYWTFLAGAILLKLSWFLGGAPNAAGSGTPRSRAATSTQATASTSGPSACRCWVSLRWPRPSTSS